MGRGNDKLDYWGAGIERQAPATDSSPSADPNAFHYCPPPLPSAAALAAEKKYLYEIITAFQAHKFADGDWQAAVLLIFLISMTGPAPFWSAPH